MPILHGTKGGITLEVAEEDYNNLQQQIHLIHTLVVQMPEDRHKLTLLQKKAARLRLKFPDKLERLTLEKYYPKELGLDFKRLMKKKHDEQK